MIAKFAFLSLFPYFNSKTINLTCVEHYLRLLLGLLALQGGISDNLPAQGVPFQKGVNLTQWFQAPSARQIQFTRFTREDFEQIKSLGCDVIRLPINLHFMTDGPPNYQIDPLFYTFLDQVVDWTEELDIHLILDNHTFDPSVATDPQVGEVLVKVWSQMAQHYKDRSESLYYEVLNEPHGIADSLWGAIQGKVIQAIRAEDPVHTIIVGGTDFNSYRKLQSIPIYDDDNLIYTFHFYDPFLFTHQGATWVSPSMLPLADIPFPYDESRMPSLPAELLGTWIGFNYLNYPLSGNVASVQSLIDIALQFRKERGVPIYCGEMGVYKPNSQQKDRVYWYEQVRSYLDQNNIPWTSWDYEGGFGLFENGSNELFDHDLNVPLLKALDFNTPSQTEYQQIPEAEGFPIYGDFIEKDVFESSYFSGFLDYYSQDQPNHGEYCIKWSEAEQYGIIGLDLKPDKDLTRLVEEGYAIDLMIRGDQPGTSIDFRFMDTQIPGTDDRPWRMGITIDEGLVTWDGRWHHLHIPLQNFTERGAWDDGWYDPIGAFDWTAIDRMEFVAEHHPLGNARIWLDQIHITNLDTAQVNITTVFSDTPTSFLRTIADQISIYPNPVEETLNIHTGQSLPLSAEMIDPLGRSHREISFSNRASILVDGLAPGLYVLTIRYKSEIVHLDKILVR